MERELENKLTERVELSYLYDFYGELLKDHQKNIFEDYILNDLSLSEIAEEQGISRQGVFDLLKRCSKQLKNYESSLHLVEKFRITREKAERIRSLAEQIRSDGDAALIKEIVSAADDILEEL